MFAQPGAVAQPSFDAYGAGTVGAPPVTSPYNPSPGFGQSAFGQPTVQPQLSPTPLNQPTFGGQPAFTQPGTATPIGAPQPFGAPAYNGTPYNPGTSPVGWQSGTYQYQNPDGSSVRLQRLLQQISFEHTYLYGGNDPDDLGINRTELAATFAFPIFYNPDTPLLITPGFAFNWLDGPIDTTGDGSGPDLPARVYDAYLDASWYPRLTEFLSADLGLRTGVWTDFEEVNSDSVRILGRGMGVMSFSPKFDLLAGVWYLDRNDVRLLPAGGAHWRPTPEWDLYLVFPNPKIRKKARTIGSSQWYWYVAGEYGGGRWTLQRASGAADDVDINDIRVQFGLEWETLTQIRGHFEVGYVFDREIVYDATRSPPAFKLDDTFMFRAGVDF
ncbi:MAG: hypothetical protein AAGA92_14725 [Planctomycetota bacterium]